MLKRLCIIGNANHAHHIKSSILAYDEDMLIEMVPSESLQNCSYEHVIIGIGDNEFRNQCYDKLVALGHHIPTLDLSGDDLKFVFDGRGNQIFKYAVLYETSHLGKNIIVNSRAVVEHHVIVNDSTHVCPGAVLLGACSIGSSCKIGANSVIHPKVKICDNVDIGAMSLVTKNIEKKGTYFGIPC